MPWQPLPHIAFAVATYPFAASYPEDLVLEIGDELYIIEETSDGNWLRGYLLKPPSLLAGLTSVKGQTLEARVFSGIFPRSCVEVRELLGESDDSDDADEDADGANTSDDGSSYPAAGAAQRGSDSAKSGVVGGQRRRKKSGRDIVLSMTNGGSDGNKNSRPSSTRSRSATAISLQGHLSVPILRDPDAPKPQAPVPMLKIGDETPTSAAEPLIDEIASCLREWHSTNLHELLLSRQYHKLDILSQLITSLNQARQQFLHNVLTSWEYTKLREKTVWDLVRVNKLCGGEVIVRDPAERGRILTGDDSVVEITGLQSVMSLLNEPPQPQVELTALHHLLVDVKGFAGACTEGTSLVLSLVGRVGDKLVRLSESFTTAVPSGMMGHLFNRASMRTLFSDLSAADIGETTALDSDLFLVVAVRSAQHIALAGQPHQAKPNSRSGAGSAGQGGSISSNGTGNKDASRPPLSSGNKSARRSLMWGGKSSRSAFSRGSNNPKLDALNELAEERPGTSSAPASREGYAPPSTANSKSSSSRTPFDAAQRVAADRTTGIGVLKLNAIMKRQEDDVEHVINIFAPSDRAGASERQLGEDWEPFIKKLMLSKTGHFEKSRGSERVQLHLRAFNHQDADTLIKSTPTMLSGIVKTSKMGFSGAPTKPRSDIYLTINDAVLTRQVLLSRYGASPAPLPSSLQGHNLQVTLEVRRSNGDRIDGCIFPYSNTEGLSTWRSTTVERDDGWRQTLRLSLSPPDVSSAHVVMFVADMPNPPFAVAHMPLWDQAAFVRDGSHGLVMYRIDEHTVTPQPQPGAAPGRGGGYLSLPWSTKGRVENQTVVTGVLANLRVDSYLCSTRFSQDRVVLGLLKWREGPKDAVAGLLQQLIFVPEIEVVKLLSEVLDALFAILVEYSGNDRYEDLVFTALVRVLDIVHDRRFNVGPLVDHYAENKFNYPFATPCLVRSFTRLLSKPTEPEISRKLRATFKVVRHILKFIAHARDQQRVKEAGIGITSTTPSFTRHIQSIFKALEAMMRNAAPVLVGSQTLAVQHFHTWLPELAGLLSTEEILHIAIDFMDACASVKGKLVLYKLVLIINYSRLDIFSHPEQRSALSANTVRWIAPHWGHSDNVTDQWKAQVRLCCSILASQIEHLGPEIPDYIPKILDSYLAINHAAESAPDAPKAFRTRLSLLFPTQYPFPSRPIAFPEGRTEPAFEGKPSLAEQPFQPQFDEALVELSSVLSALSNSSSGMQLEMADGDLAVIIENTLRVHMSILRGEAFPSTWLSVHIFHHNSIMRNLQYLANILLESFLLDPDEAEEFNTELWKMLFSTLLMLVSSPSLALETFPEQKRRAVWKIAGDVREHGAELLRRTWEAIGWDTAADERQRYNLTKMGGYQVQYVPALVGPIVELCLSVHEGLRRMAVEVLQTMIVSEWTLSEDLSIIQAEIIDYLDHYFKTKPLTESILQKLFVGELLNRFSGLASVPDEPLYAALRELIGTIDEFLDLLVAVHGSDGEGVSDVVVAGSGSPGEASHLINRLRLMEFLRDMQKEEMFVRYVHQLATLQAASRNNAEAGLALRLHAELYDWDPLRTVPALLDPPFPAQTHFERKERIYFDMIKHFEDGEAWSSALAAYKELQVQYETNIYDFAKLARTERAIATVYETITKSDRLVPKYFHVVFRGLGFPSSVRDKEFVYEGSPNERTGAFTDRMQEQYPAAQIVVVSSSAAANSRVGTNPGGGVVSGAGSTEEMLDDIVEGQFLVVSALSPHRDFSHHVFQRARVPQVIRDYLVSSHPQSFSVTSRRHVTGPVTGHYVDKTVYTTAEPFPTILRRSEIVSVGEVRLSAKEAALERTLRKTAEITAVEKKMVDGDNSPETVKLLLDAISISVNPDSENSIVGYRQLLPTARNGGQNSDEEKEGEGSVSDEAEDVDEDGEPPELDPQEIAIKMALVDHSMVIKRCLAMIGRSANESFCSYAEGLTKHFEDTFAPEIAVFTPPPPPPPRETLSTSPTWSRSSPTDTGPHRLPEAGSTHERGNSLAGSGSIGPDAAIEEGAAVQPVALRPARGARLSFLPGNAHRKRDSFAVSNSDSASQKRRSGTGGDADAMSENGRRSRENANRHSFFRPSMDRSPRLPMTETTVTATATATVVAASRSSSSLRRQNTNGNSGNKMNDWFSESGIRRSLDLVTSDRRRSISGSGTVMSGGSGVETNHVNGTEAGTGAGAGTGTGTGNGTANGNGGGGGGGGGLIKKNSVRKRLSMLKLGKKSSKGSGVMVAVDEE